MADYNLMSLYTCSVCAPFCSNPAEHASVHYLYGLCKPELCLLVLLGVENTKDIIHEDSYAKVLNRVTFIATVLATIASTVVHQGS